MERERNNMKRKLKERINSDNTACVYMRMWDLQQIDLETLNKYNLKAAMYIYVGQTSEKYFESRTSKWKYEIKYRPENVEKTIVQFYNRMKKLYITEFEMTEEDFDNLFFYNANVVINEAESKAAARQRETAVLNTIIPMLPIFKNVVLLNYSDSNFKRNKKDNSLELEYPETAARMNFNFDISPEESENKLNELIENDKIRVYHSK